MRLAKAKLKALLLKQAMIHNKYKFFSYCYGKVFIETSIWELLHINWFDNPLSHLSLFIDTDRQCEQLRTLYHWVQLCLNLEPGNQNEYVLKVDDKIDSGGATPNNLKYNDVHFQLAQYIYQTTTTQIPLNNIKDLNNNSIQSVSSSEKIVLSASPPNSDDIIEVLFYWLLKTFWTLF